MGNLTREVLSELKYSIYEKIFDKNCPFPEILWLCLVVIGSLLIKNLESASQNCFAYLSHFYWRHFWIKWQQKWNKRVLFCDKVGPCKR